MLLLIYFIFLISFLLLLVCLNVLTLGKKSYIKPSLHKILFFYISIIGFIGTALYALYEKRLFSRVTFILLLLAFLSTTIGWLSCKYTNQVKKTIFFTLVSCLAFLFAGYHYSPIGRLVFHSLQRSDPQIKILLILHIFSSTVAYLCFAISCLASISFLYQQRLLKEKKNFYVSSLLPSLSLLEKASKYTIITGISLGFIGLLFGISIKIMANQNELFFSIRLLLPLLTVCFYFLFLVYSRVQGMSGRKVAIWSILGFVFALFALLYEYISLSVLS